MSNLKGWDIVVPNSATTSPALFKFIKYMAIIFILIPFFVLFLPWQQNVTSFGKVTAYSPNNRLQSIDSPIAGVVSKWHVQEGSYVNKGDLLVELSDIDPNYLSRIESQNSNLESKLESKINELSAYELQKQSLISARNAKISTAQFKADMAKQKVLSAEQSVISAKASVDVASAQRDRFTRLSDEGLVSKRDLEVAERDYIIATRALESAAASLNSAKAEVNSALSEINQVTADTAAYLQSTDAVINKIKAETADSKNSLVSSNISLSRQENQKVYAPVSGHVFRLPVNSSSRVIKQGDSLLSIVPDLNENDRAVELWVDGRDAPLILKGSVVRLEFEGWPAIQVPGWAQVGAGTFEGEISFVDPTDNGSGLFRVLAIPKKGTTKWPEARFLRQGISAKGWILLEKVSIGYEIWRLLNGFPPRIPQEPLSQEGSPK